MWHSIGHCIWHSFRHILDLTFYLANIYILTYLYSDILADMLSCALFDILPGIVSDMLSAFGGLRGQDQVGYIPLHVDD
jgi:hypothetical protein